MHNAHACHAIREIRRDHYVRSLLTTQYTHTQHIVRCEFITYESKAMAILRHELHVQRALARTTTNITSPKVDTKYIYAAVHNAIRMDQPISAIRTQRYSAICVSFAELCYCWRYCCTTTSKFSLLF